MTNKSHVALITGAASGIGQALAVAYAKSNVRVIGGYFEKDPHDPTITQNLVEQNGGECLMVSLDVGNAESVEQATKKGVVHFGRKIRCNAIIPGLIETPQSLDAKNSLGPDGLKAAGRVIPLGRVGRAEEVADVIQFLTSSKANYVTGQSIIVDGGLTIRWPD